MWLTPIDNTYRPWTVCYTVEKNRCHLPEECPFFDILKHKLITCLSSQELVQLKLKFTSAKRGRISLHQH